MSRSAAFIRHDIDYMDEFAWQPYIGIIIPTELHTHLDVCDMVGSLLSFEPSFLTSIVTLFGEYNAMIGAPYSTYGYSNGGTAAIINCKIGTCNQSPTLSRLPIVVVGTLDYSGSILAIIARITGSTTASTTACLTGSRAILDSSSQNFLHSHHSRRHSHNEDWWTVNLVKAIVPPPPIVERVVASICILRSIEEVVDEYIPSPSAPAEVDGSGPVKGHVVGHQYNL
ncbi:uncharacterized protein DS421_14g471550 [Arachis hypogaea]|nr:uncharacterized protein DS421_14g471550 [Arachis hypogaea]